MPEFKMFLPQATQMLLRNEEDHLLDQEIQLAATRPTLFPEILAYRPELKASLEEMKKNKLEDFFKEQDTEPPPVSAGPEPKPSIKTIYPEQKQEPKQEPKQETKPQEKWKAKQLVSSWAKRKAAE